MLGVLERSIEEVVISAIAKTVETMNPLLLPDRVEAYSLHDVFERVIDGCRDEIVLSFGDCFLSFKIEPDVDTIEAQFHDKKFVSKRSYHSIGHDDPWTRYLNQECGWTWLAINQQGYWDTVLISFETVVPNVLLNVMASSIHVFAVGPMRTTTKDKVAPIASAVPRLCRSSSDYHRGHEGGGDQGGSPGYAWFSQSSPCGVLGEVVDRGASCRRQSVFRQVCDWAAEG